MIYIAWRMLRLVVAWVCRKLIKGELDHGEIRTIVGYGNGPIDAVKDAFNENGFVYTHFLDYSEHSLSSGSSSKAAAYVYLRVKGSAVQEYGVGVHPNITTATIKAIISAMNRIHKQLKK